MTQFSGSLSQISAFLFFSSSGVFEELARQVAPDLAQRLDIYSLCLNYVLSNPVVDCAIVGMRFAEDVEKKARLSDDVSLRLDLKDLHPRPIRP